MRHRSTITIPKDRATLIREALCREEAVRLHRENEAEIVGELEPLEVPSPRAYRPEKINWLEVIINAINPKQYLP